MAGSAGSAGGRGGNDPGRGATPWPLLDAALAIHSEPSVFSPAGRFPNVQNANLPVSRQTTRFYRDGPSFLRRYFSFGVANFLDRAWVLAIPLLTLAFPLVRAAPPLYR